MNDLETANEAVEVVQTRTFDAPLLLVWRVWTEVEHRNQWWGRPGFATVCELDLRPGGRPSVPCAVGVPAQPNARTPESLTDRSCGLRLTTETPRSTRGIYLDDRAMKAVRRVTKLPRAQ
jgi:hypothetical protein